MGMTGSGMAAAVSAQLQSAFPGMTSDQITQLNDSLSPLCEGIVTYIQANAVVNPNTLNNPAGQPVTVAIPAGTGATTAPETIQGTGTIS